MQNCFDKEKEQASVLEGEVMGYEPGSDVPYHG